MEEAVSLDLHKDSKILVPGRLQPGEDGSPRHFQRQHGSNAVSYEVVDNVRFLNVSNDGHSQERVQTMDQEQIDI